MNRLKLIALLLLSPPLSWGALPNTIKDADIREVVEYLDGKVNKAQKDVNTLSGATQSTSTIVAISHGGTGATTASGARNNLAVPGLDGTGASGTWGISITGGAGSATTAGNATTANSLAADPTDCTLPNVALGINASGTAQCSQPSDVTGNANTATTASNIAASGVAAGNLGAGVVSSSISINTVNNSNQIVDGTITGPDIAVSTVSLDKLNQTGCPINSIVKWDGSKWDCGVDFGDVDTVTDFRYEDWSAQTNGVTTQFTFTDAPSTNSVTMVKNGIVLSPVYDYTMHTTSVTFLTAPATGTTLIAKYGISAVAVSVLKSSNVWTARQYFMNTGIGIGTTTVTSTLTIVGTLSVDSNVTLAGNTFNSWPLQCPPARVPIVSASPTAGDWLVTGPLSGIGTCTSLNDSKLILTRPVVYLAGSGYNVSGDDSDGLANATQICKEIGLVYYSYHRQSYGYNVTYMHYDGSKWVVGSSVNWYMLDVTCSRQ